MDRGRLDGLAAQLEAILAADREVLRQLQNEVDGLGDELRELQDETGQQQQRGLREQQSAEQLAVQSRELESKLREAKRRLEEAHEDRRAANLEALSLRYDRDHFREELTFLQRTLQEERDTAEAICRANWHLQHSNADLAAESDQLEQQRRELLQQVVGERGTNR